MNLRKYFSKFLLIFLIFFLFVERSFSVEPDKFIQSLADEASKVLVNSLSKEEKIEKLKSIALKSVDIKGIGLYTLGSNRKNLSDAQKKNIMNYLKNTF